MSKPHRVTFRSAPEYRSIADFAEYLADDERDTFNADDLVALAYRTDLAIPAIRAALESYGFTIAARPVPRPVRGINANNHDRWTAYRV